MENPDERRLYARYNLPIVIEAPALSDVPCEVVNVSAGGFMVVVQRKPDPEIEYELSFKISDMVFEKCKAAVTWTRKSESNPNFWSVGLLIHMPDSEREKFLAALEEVHAKLNEGA